MDLFEQSVRLHQELNRVRAKSSWCIQDKDESDNYVKISIDNGLLCIEGDGNGGMVYLTRYMVEKLSQVLGEILKDK